MFLDKKEIPLWKRIVVRIIGDVFAYEKDSLRYHIGYCSKHGYYIDHLRGYYRKLSCPKCLKERNLQLQKHPKPQGKA